MHSVETCPESQVRHTHVSKHVDTACVYRYHHRVSQYQQYRIFGISISPSLVHWRESVQCVPSPFTHRCPACKHACHRPNDEHTVPRLGLQVQSSFPYAIFTCMHQFLEWILVKQPENSILQGFSKFLQFWKGQPWVHMSNRAHPNCGTLWMSSTAYAYGRLTFQKIARTWRSPACTQPNESDLVTYPYRHGYTFCVRYLGHKYDTDLLLLVWFKLKDTDLLCTLIQLCKLMQSLSPKDIAGYDIMKLSLMPYVCIIGWKKG